MSNTVKYLDRQHQPLSQKEWREKFGDASYATVKETPIATVAIETAWVGVACAIEKDRPKLFLVQVIERLKGESKDREEPLWFASEKEALAAHQAAVKRWRNRIDVVKG